MTNQGSTTTRPLLWEDEPPAEFRVRRMAPDDEGAPRAGRARRTSPGMPLEFDDPDDDGVLRPTASRFGSPKRPWWRPASAVGRTLFTVSVVLVLGAFTTAGLMLKHYLERDARFRIAGTENIQATGLDEVGRADLLPVFGEDIGRNVFFVPLSERRRQLEQIPWIERATVMRVLPDQIRVHVVERQPVAFTRRGQQIGLVDANGVLLDMAPKAMAQRHYSFPVLTGIDAGDSPESRKGRMAMYLRLMSELDAGGRHNSEQISEIDLTDPEDARILMPEQGTDILVHLGEERFLDRFERYKAHIAEWRQRYPQLSAVDLRFDHVDQRVVLQMASGAQTPEGSGKADANASAPGDAAAANPRGRAEAKPSASAAHKPAVKKSKPAPNKKHAAVKRTALDAHKPTSHSAAAAKSKVRSHGRPAAAGVEGGE